MFLRRNWTLEIDCSTAKFSCGNAATGSWKIGRFRFDNFWLNSGENVLAFLPDFPVCFAFTYTSIARSQRIDLIKCGCQPEILDLLKPRIIVSEWLEDEFSFRVYIVNCSAVLSRHSHRFDCTSTYKLICWLKSATGETLDKKSTECKAIGGHWEWVSWKFGNALAFLTFS